MRQQLIKAMHSSALGGHSGVLATYKRLRSLFYWPSMQSDIQRLVQECDTCQRNKTENIVPPGLLQLLSVPDHHWKHISMDFIEGLPKSEGKDTILVVIDMFNKYAHFIPLLHPFNTAHVAKAFLYQLYKLHGLPQSIVSDKDSVHKHLLEGTC